MDAPIERAFTVFTERIGDFKPPEHNLLGGPVAETVFEPRVGGGITDRATDGSECRWARILAFDPPDRVIFSWDISPRWAIETDQAQTQPALDGPVALRRGGQPGPRRLYRLPSAAIRPRRSSRCTARLPR